MASWSDNIPAPMDANGDVVPLTTEAMCYGGKMRRVLRISYFRKDNVWAVQTASVTAPVESFSLHSPDSWERLLEDLDRAAGTSGNNVCACSYLTGDASTECYKCGRYEKGRGCSQIMTADVARRIRALREADEDAD